MRLLQPLVLVLMLASNLAIAQAIPISINAGPSPQRYEILFMGNSHSAANGLPDLLSKLIEAGLPNATARSDLAPGWKYLADRLNDGVSEQMLNSRPWTHVILQAQKYSSSGQYFYPTTAAEQWIRKAKARSALPIMFPEWPRRGNTEEGPRVHQLHLDIASREAACVAPIGLTWEASLYENPDTVLHAADGNHSNLNGAALTAYVLYEVITAPAAPFSLAGDGSCSVFPMTLAPTQSCTIDVAFSTEIDGLFDATIELNTLSPAMPVMVKLTGFRGQLVPALNHWGMIAMALLLASSAGFLKK
jgi:hypothetical protein